MVVIVAALALILSPSAKAGSLKFEKDLDLAEIRPTGKTVEFSEGREFRPVAEACEGESCGGGIRPFPAMKPLAALRDTRDMQENINAPRVSLVDEMEKILGAPGNTEAAEEE